jgi:predicted Zn-ribbon and HTH transcriptional regulator
MLALSTVEKIDRLLKEGKLSQRKIAECLHVSRSVVSEIARGRRALFGRVVEADEADSSRLVPPERCPKCGYFVHVPCLVCRTREYRHGRRVLEALAVGRTVGSRPVRHRPTRRQRRQRRRNCHARVA